MMKHLKEKFQELYGSREARLFLLQVVLISLANTPITTVGTFSHVPLPLESMDLPENEKMTNSFFTLIILRKPVLLSPLF